jgi:hypothetical protein
VTVQILEGAPLAFLHSPARLFFFVSGCTEYPFVELLYGSRFISHVFASFPFALTLRQAIALVCAKKSHWVAFDVSGGDATPDMHSQMSSNRRGLWAMIQDLSGRPANADASLKTHLKVVRENTIQISERWEAFTVPEFHRCAL